MLTMPRAGCCCAAAVAPSIRTNRTPVAIGRAIRIIGDLREGASYRNRRVTGILPATEFRAARNRHEVNEISKPKSQIRTPDTCHGDGEHGAESLQHSVLFVPPWFVPVTLGFGVSDLEFGIAQFRAKQ